MRIFVGWDSREDLAYRVCCKSLWRYTTQPLDIFPIMQTELREKGIFTREPDPFSSTEFSFTRFLTPYLNDYHDWALFMDCDFMWRGDVAALLDYQDNSKAVMVVKHKYKPKEETKMDGAVQTQYPRKNWSSLMLINCAHPDVRQNLTPQVVNIATGMYLHRFRWTSDENIGDLPVGYNYLEGWYTQKDCPNPQAVHFTRGGPWFKEWAGVEYAKEWTQLAKEITDG